MTSFRKRLHEDAMTSVARGVAHIGDDVVSMVFRGKIGTHIVLFVSGKPRSLSNEHRQPVIAFGDDLKLCVGCWKMLNTRLITVSDS